MFNSTNHTDAQKYSNSQIFSGFSNNNSNTYNNHSQMMMNNNNNTGASMNNNNNNNNELSSSTTAVAPFVGFSAEHMEFSTFCRDVLDKIAHLQDIDRKKEVIRQLLDDIAFQDVILHNQKYPDFYSFLRLLLPGNDDSERKRFYVDEKKIIAHILSVIAIGKQHTDAASFTNWKQDTSKVHLFSDAVVSFLAKRHHLDGDKRAFGDFIQKVAPDHKEQQQVKQKRSFFRFVVPTEKNPNARPQYSVAELNRDLDKFCQSSGNHNNNNNTESKKEEFFKKILGDISGTDSRITYTEIKYIIRIIMRSLNIHFGAASILPVLSTDATESLKASNSLREVCVDAAKEAIDGTHNNNSNNNNNNLSSPSRRIQVRYGSALQPMLASNSDTREMMTILNSKTYFSEPKYDGERILIHIRFHRRRNVHDNTLSALQMETHYFTRRQNNAGATYAEKFDGVLRTHLDLGCIDVSRELPTHKNDDDKVVWKLRPEKSIRGLQAGSHQWEHNLEDTTCILDGEFLVFDKEREKYAPFGANRSLGLNKAITINNILDGTAPSWFCYQAFDIVFLNGVSLTDLPLYKRKRILERVLVPKPQHLEKNMGTEVRSLKAAFEQLDKEIFRDNEGIVMKNVASPYNLGERKKEWIKLKADNIDGLMDTFEVVILGGFIGTKFQRQNENEQSDFTHFLIGIWAGGKKPVSDEDDFSNNNNIDSAAATRHIAQDPRFFDSDRMISSLKIENYDLQNNTFELNNLPPSPQDPNAKFITVGKVSNGLDFEELTRIRQALRDNWEIADVQEERRRGTIDFQKIKEDRLKGFRAMPRYLAAWKPKDSRDIPDVFVRDPRQSVILEVGGYQFVPTDKFLLGKTVRFPKVVKVIDHGQATTSCFDSIDRVSDFMKVQNIINSSSKTITSLGFEDDEDFVEKLAIGSGRRRKRNQENNENNENTNNNNRTGAFGRNQQQFAKQNRKVANHIGLPLEWANTIAANKLLQSTPRMHPDPQRLQQVIFAWRNDPTRIPPPFLNKTICVLEFDEDSLKKTMLNENVLERKGTLEQLRNWKTRKDIYDALFIIGGAAKIVGNHDPAADYVFSTSARVRPVHRFIQAMSMNQNSADYEKLYKKYKCKSVLSLDWLRRSLFAFKEVPKTPQDVIYCQADSALDKQLKSDFDEFQDGYEAKFEVNRQMLQRSMNLARAALNKDPAYRTRLRENPDAALKAARDRFAYLKASDNESDTES